MSTSNFRRWLILTLALAGIVLAAVVGASEYMIRRYIEPVHTFDAHVRYVYRTSSVNAVFGDSYASMGFQGQPSFAKLAKQGEKPNLMLVKAQAYFRDRPAKKVIVQASATMFKTAENGDADYDLDYGQIFGAGSLGWLRVLRPHHRLALRRYWMTLGQKRALRSDRFIDDNGELKFYEFNREYADGSEKFRRDRARHYLKEVSENTPIFPNRNIEYYVKLLHFLKNKGADVCLVVFPVSESFLAVASENEKFNKMIDFFKELAISENIKMVNMIGTFLDNKKYWNGTHVHQSLAPKIADTVVARCYGPEG